MVGATSAPGLAASSVASSGLAGYAASTCSSTTKLVLLVERDNVEDAEPLANPDVDLVVRADKTRECAVLSA